MVKEIADAYIAAGLSIIPVKLDGSKAPAVASWKRFMAERPTRGNALAWFCRPAGIGIVCGLVSGGLEVFDFDHRPDETFFPWFDALPSGIRGKLSVIETGGGGFHVPFRCDVIGGCKKIAKTADNAHTIIETKAEGGYIVAVGSPLEVHNSGNPYVQVMGRPLPELPKLTPDERKTLWITARRFDERSRREVVAANLPKPKRPPANIDTSTPWGAFDVEADWADILGLHGWQSSDGVRWMRPGKNAGGISARVVIAENGCDVLTVFSSSAGPLSPTNTTHRTWGKFAAYAALEHGGDRKQAARAARAKGYGGNRR